MPDNFAPRDGSNPYADYTEEKLYGFLSSYALPRDIGAKYEYSNLGGTLLGHVLVLKAGTNYEALVAGRICGPLGMTNTRITLPAEWKARLAGRVMTRRRAGGQLGLWHVAGAGGLAFHGQRSPQIPCREHGPGQDPACHGDESGAAPQRDTDLSATRVGLAWCISRRRMGPN